MRFEGTLTANPVSLKFRVSPLISSVDDASPSALSQGELNLKETPSFALQRGDWRWTVKDSSTSCLCRDCCINALNISLPASEDLLCDFNDVRGVERLRHNPVNLRGLAFVRADGFAPARDDRQRNVLVLLTNWPRQCPAAHLRHAHVREDRIERLAREKRERLAPAFCQDNIAALFLQDVAAKVSGFFSLFSKQKTFSFDWSE